MHICGEIPFPNDHPQLNIPKEKDTRYLITKKWLIVILSLAIVLATAMAVGVWTGNMKIDSSSFDTTIAAIGTVGSFYIVFSTSRRDFSKTSKTHRNLKNQLPLWIWPVAGTQYLTNVPKFVYRRAGSLNRELHIVSPELSAAF